MGEIRYKLADGKFRREMIDGDWEILVRAAMQRHGLSSVTKLAKMMGVSRQTWYSWLRGDSLPQNHHWQKLAVFAGFPDFRLEKAS